MRASLLASATAATRRGRRASSAFSQGLASTALGQGSTAWAPVINRRRSSVSPRLTLPTKAELLGTDVTGLMITMSETFGKRLGIKEETVASAHRAMVEALFPAPARCHAAVAKVC